MDVLRNRPRNSVASRGNTGVARRYPEYIGRKASQAPEVLLLKVEAQLIRQWQHWD